MSKTTYFRCTNPKCRKLNPAPPNEAKKVKEYTCVFCGTIITLFVEKETDEKTSSKKKEQDKRYTLQKSESRPINRNTRKPNI